MDVLHAVKYYTLDIFSHPGTIACFQVQKVSDTCVKKSDKQKKKCFRGNFHKSFSALHSSNCINLIHWIDYFLV